MTSAKKENASPLSLVVDQRVVMREVDKIEKEVALIVKKLKGMSPDLADDEDYQAACNVLLDVVERRKYIDEQRDGFLQEIKALLARVESWFAQSYEDIEKSEDFFRGAIKSYALKLQAEADGLRRAADLLPKKQEARREELLTQANAIMPPKVGGISLVTRPTVEILDPKNIPDEFMKKVPDNAKILAALTLGQKVTGAKLVPNKTVTVNPKNRGAE